jgi:hypothetical protein
MDHTEVAARGACGLQCKTPGCMWLGKPLNPSMSLKQHKKCLNQVSNKRTADEDSPADGTRSRTKARTHEPGTMPIFDIRGGNRFVTEGVAKEVIRNLALHMYTRGRPF